MRRTVLALLALVAAALVAGCNGDKARYEGLEDLAHRELPPELRSAALTPQDLAQTYAVGAYVFARRDPATGAVQVVDDTEGDHGVALSDLRLVIYVEGSADTLDGFRYTARLIAGSERLWPAGAADAVLLLPVHWSESRNVVAEHVDFSAQRRGAVALQDMIRLHQFRHGDNPRASVSILAFSAGTRVVQMAFGARVDTTTGDAIEGEPPPYMSAVDDVAFVGSSLGRRDPTPFALVRGRFINFVNSRDTHFGDRAPNVAPAGSKAHVGSLVNPMNIVSRSPGFGASANGFDRLPWFTAADQFAAADTSAEARQAFRRVNFRVPSALVAWNLLGVKIENDDLDDFVNLAPNHYILVGRGPGGTSGGPEFAQYRDVAAEFVREFLTPALVGGRVPVTELTTEPHPIRPLDILTAPIKVPAAIIEQRLRKDDSSKESPGPEKTKEK